MTEHRDRFWPNWFVAAVLGFAIVSSLVGCESPPASQVSLAEKYRVPPGATDIVELGDHWVSFEITTDGSTRKFLHTYYVWPETYMSTIEVTPR